MPDLMSNGYWIEGDCLEVMSELSRVGLGVHSVVTDGPYGIGFLGKEWDSHDNIVFRPEVWRRCYQLLPPGGHLLAFSSTRTYHRIACAIENAGFEIRDQIQWVHGQGFPHSLNVAKSIDRISRGVGVAAILSLPTTVSMRGWAGTAIELPRACSTRTPRRPRRGNFCVRIPHP